MDGLPGALPRAIFVRASGPVCHQSVFIRVNPWFETALCFLRIFAAYEYGGAHGVSRHSSATAEVTRPTFAFFAFFAVEEIRI